MNKIFQFFESISSEELTLAVKEIRIFRNTGIVPSNGYIKFYCDKVRELSNGCLPTELNMVEIEVLRQFSYRVIDNKLNN